MSASLSIVNYVNQELWWHAAIVNPRVPFIKSPESPKNKGGNLVNCTHIDLVVVPQFKIDSGTSETENGQVAKRKFRSDRVGWFWVRQLRVS